MSVLVTKTGSSTWRAHGFFNGRPLDATGSSKESAASHWKQKAEYEAKD